MANLVPKYTFWESLEAALAIGTKALQEVRDLARQPGPAGKDGRDGVAYDGIEEEMKDGGRWLIRRHKLNDAIVTEQKFQLATIIYRGVFKEGQRYLRGDTVSYAGSTWHCDEDTIDKPDKIGGKKSWTLAAKRGRDGKDGGTPPSTPRGPIKVG